jgi:hypothetical protein
MGDATRDPGAAGTSRTSCSSSGEARPDRLDELAAEVDDLRIELVELRHRLLDEVRTRRLVVVSDDAFERVVADAFPSHGGVEVRSRGPAGSTTVAGLFAVDADEGDPANIGLALSSRGDVAALLDLYEGHQPRVWIDPGLPSQG